MFQQLVVLLVALSRLIEAASYLSSKECLLSVVLSSHFPKNSITRRYLLIPRGPRDSNPKHLGHRRPYHHPPNAGSKTLYPALKVDFQIHFPMDVKLSKSRH